MSEGEMNKHEGEAKEQEAEYHPIIAVYEPERLNEDNVEKKLKTIYVINEYPMCGSYEKPSLAPIRERKAQLGKAFAEEGQNLESEEYSSFDGVYGFTSTAQVNSDNMIRQKIRMVRDLREQFYQQNGQFIIEKAMFSQELSKLANISFEGNQCIQHFEKNAILSERKNQKKQTPFSMELSIGGLWFNKHPLNNEEEKQFQKIRVLLKQWALVSSHPVLPELEKELRYLQAMMKNIEDQAQGEGRRRQEFESTIEQLKKKMEMLDNKKQEQKRSIENLLTRIIQRCGELKTIRKNTGMETVPWKIHIKQCKLEGMGEKRSYDIGVTPSEVSEKVALNQADVEMKRRESIRDQSYFIQIYANNEYIGKSEKFKLQWPSFKVPIYEKFTIMVYTAPATIKVEVVKSGLINQVIDTIYLAVPGLNAKSLTSSEKRFAATSFCLNGKEFRKKLKEEQKQSQAPSGILLHRIEWKGEGSKMPMMAPKTAQQETACTEDLQSDQRYSVQDLFDPKDPRARHKDLHQRGQQEIKKTGNALLPFLNVQSKRHLLLKYKTSRPDLENIQVPLLENDVMNREDLTNIYQNQLKKQPDQTESTQDTFNPLAGAVFSFQDKDIIQKIIQLFKKIQFQKQLSSGSGGNIRFKITEQIVSEYTFEQQLSPIVVFFKELFTQRRKLGPRPAEKAQTKIKIDEIEVNLHVRSARNMPIRENSYERIKGFQEEQKKFKAQLMAQLAVSIFDNFQGYGQGFFRQQPNVNMFGNTFYTGFQNQGRNQEVSYNQHLRLDRVNSCIELRFKKLLRRTPCFQGPFPEWNNTLFFNYNMKKQEKNANKILMNEEESLKVIVYDQFEQSKPTRAIAQLRVQKSQIYLGRIDVPFSFLLAVPSVSGLFKVNRPLIQFGYGIKKTGLFEPDLDEELTKTQSPDTHTYLNIDLFTEPVIDTMLAYNSDRKAIQGGENPQVLQAASQWLQNINSKRYVRMWLNNLQGKSIFICKYLSDDISPPKLDREIENGSHIQRSAFIGNLIQRSARYVSLIPRKYDCKMMQGTEQFHMNCAQFLTLKMGDDHGILLCNYFNYIDKLNERNNIESLLMICKAFPYGKTIFVLRRDKNTKNCEIWDPYKGECFTVTVKQYQTFCCFIQYEKQIDNSNDRGKDPAPIIEVSCLVSKDNIYYNLQNEIKPPNIDFDIDNDKLWKPFLNERTKNQLFDKGIIKSIQIPITSDFYPPLKLKQHYNLEASLYEHIKKSFKELRANNINPNTFKANSNISDLIRNNILPICQTFKVDYRLIGKDSPLYSSSLKENFETAVNKLQEERENINTSRHIPHDKKLYGFTLNMTYTTHAEVLEKVLDTQIHKEENQNIEYVIAVRCFDYPGYIISVWIFVGMIM